MKAMRSRVVIVGAGNVGAATAFCIVSQGLCDELVLIDIDREKAMGEALDLQHATVFMNRNVRVTAGDYGACGTADVVIITASAPMEREADNRLKMLEKSKAVMRSMIGSIMESGFGGILLVVSNPVDVMAYYAWKLSGLPAGQVIGSGTTLDTARLCCLAGGLVGVDPRSVEAYVIGEHGDSEMMAWSTATIGGKDFYNVVRDNEERVGEDPCEDLRKQTIDAGWDIFRRKGNTSFGIAASVCSILKSILYDENRIYPVSVKLSGQYGESDVYVSVPVIIDHSGAKEIVEIRLSEEERRLFHDSCSVVREYCEDLKTEIETKEGRK